jgi:steroid delta-isomerase-like uncharacterized protein
MPQQTQSADQNKKTVHRFMEECWNRGNVNTASELLTDRVQFHDPVFPNLNAGIQNVKNHIEQCRKAFPDLHFTIDDTIAEHDEVVIHWTARGTHSGPFLGMQPTNRKATVNGTSIYRLEDGKIAEEYANWNLATMLGQLGVGQLPKEAMSGAYQETRQEARSRR